MTVLRRTLWGFAPLTELSGGTTKRRRRSPGGLWAEQEGRVAFEIGIPVTNNPYHRQDDRKLWNRGWHRARMAAQRKKR